LDSNWNFRQAGAISGFRKTQGKAAMSGSCFLLQLCHQLNYWLQNQLQRVDPARFKAPDIESISSDTLEQQSDPSEPSDVTTENRWNEEKPHVLLAFPPDLIAMQLTQMDAVTH
jgi:hypothetical protein